MRRDQAAIIEQLQALVQQMSRIADTQIELVRQMGEITTVLTEMSEAHLHQPETVRQGDDSRSSALRGLADLARREEE